MSPVETGLLSGKIPYIRGGSGAKHAIVFFGGNAIFKRLDTSSNPSRYAGQIADLLPEGYRFTILGYEENPPEGWTLDIIVRDLAGAIETQAGEPDLLIGVSFGGFVAQRFAAEHLERFDRLVILVSGHRFSDAGWRMMGRQFEALEAGSIHEFVKDNALLFRRPWYNWLVRLKLWKNRDRLASEFKDPALILRAYRSIFSEDFARNADFAKRITVPTLVIGGTADQYFGTRVFEETARLIPNARLTLFKGETHMLPVEKSGAVASAIAAFVDSAS